MDLPGFSNYIAPFFSFIWVVFGFVCLMSPMKPNLSHFSYLVVTPNASLSDGPTVWMGVFRFCSRISNSDPTQCEKFRFFAKFNVTEILPDPIPNYVLEAPPPFITNILFLSIVFGPFVAILFASMSFRWKIESVKKFVDPIIDSGLVPWFGLVTVLSGATSLCAVYFHFDKTRRNFIAISDFVGAQFDINPGPVYPLALAGYVAVIIPLLNSVMDTFITAKLNKPAPAPTPDPPKEEPPAAPT